MKLYVCGKTARVKSIWSRLWTTSAKARPGAGWQNLNLNDGG